MVEFLRPTRRMCLRRNACAACPVRAIRAWLEGAAIESGPVFRSLTSNWGADGNTGSGENTYSIFARLGRFKPVRKERGQLALAEWYPTIAWPRLLDGLIACYATAETMCRDTGGRK